MAEAPTPRTVILGGGIAGLEALLALADLAGERTELTLVSPDPDFTYKPLTVEEPFTHQPAEHRELRPIVTELGGRFVRGAVDVVDAPGHQVALKDGATLNFDYLVVCVGTRTTGPFEHAATLRVVGELLEIDALIARALRHPSKRLAFIVPPGVSWSLPIYELALMTRRRAEQLGSDDLRLIVVTPEEAPLVFFGSVPSNAVAELLAVRGVEFEGQSRASEGPEGIILAPGQRRLDAGAAVALPLIEGRHLRGLPSDDGGFIPIDDHAQVVGVDDVYAAGDGTNFPIKQGGLASQQADAAAAHIASRLGTESVAEPFHPVLRGQLIVGAESINLEQDLTGGHGEGTVSPDYLWWPPHKVSARYLAPFLAEQSQHAEPKPPERPLEVEVAMPRRWYEEPMALDPYGPPLGPDWIGRHQATWR